MSRGSPFLATATLLTADLAERVEVRAVQNCIEPEASTASTRFSGSLIFCWRCASILHALDRRGGHPQPVGSLGSVPAARYRAPRVRWSPATAGPKRPPAS